MRTVIGVWSMLALAGLGLIGCGSNVERNIKKLEGSQDEREQAMMELVLAKEYAILPLIEVLGDRRKPVRVRVDVVEILFRVYVREGDRKILPALTKALSDPEPEIRASAALALGDIRKQDSVEPLLNMLENERDEGVKYRGLVAFETVGLETWGDWDSRSMPKRMTEEQQARFTGVLKQISTEATSDTLRDEVEEWLEVVANDICLEADQLAIKADLERAEEKYLEAKELVPGSKNVHQKLGRFYFDNGWEEKGLTILKEQGMALYARRLGRIPTIDGDLSDGAWKNAAKITEFYQCINVMTVHPIEGRSEAYVGYTDEGLFIGVKGYESSTGNLAAKERNRDGSVWGDDCVEIFIDTNHDYRTYYHIGVNSLGTVADGYNAGSSSTGSRSWNGEYKVATSVQDTFWTCEMKIPFKTLDDTEVRKGTLWGFNMARVRIANASEYGQWVPTYGFAHRPGGFGFLIFD